MGGRASFFGGNPIYQRVRQELEAPPELLDDNGHAWAADLQHDLEELSLLSHVFSRTKKRDVFPDATIRTAHVVSRHPDASRGTRVLRCGDRHSSAITHLTTQVLSRYFAIMGAQRQAASCMPASRERFIAASDMDPRG